jgi:hypothetical protein
VSAAIAGVDGDDLSNLRHAAVSPTKEDAQR